MAVSTRKSIEAARKWVFGFVLWYNYEHRHSAIRYVTPDQRHRCADKALLKQRVRGELLLKLL